MSDQKQQQAQEILLKSLGFEDSLAYLKSAGVYDHVAAVLMKLSLEKPSNALDVFENYSATVKSAKVAFPSTHDSQKLNEAHIKLQKTMLPALNKSQQLIQQSHAAADAGKVECPDLVAESQLLALAGVNLGSDTVYLLQVALRNLIKEKSLVDARFFGKVFGTQKDYFVIEAKADGSGDDAAPGSDAPGTGVNALAFFVAHTAAGPWTRLPDIGAQHIVNARAIKRVFTGNLDAPIGGYPSLALIAKRAPPPPHGSGVANDEAAAAAAADIAAFNKVNTERYLLRAQLARIAAATVVAPNNAWEKKDGEDSFSKVAAPAAIDPSQYTDLSKWLHARTHIYPNGRTKIADAENPDVDTGGVAPFRAVTESNAEKPHWIVRLTANQGLDLHPGVMCKSLTWPGAVAVAKGTHHACIYIGQGVRHSSTLFTPPAPPAIQAEYTADAAYAYKPKVDGEEAPAVAPRPPMFFAQDVSFDPRPPAPVAEEAPAE